MDSRFKSEDTSKDKEDRVKKRYCDKRFKLQLTKALKVNLAEPDNIEKVRG